MNTKKFHEVRIQVLKASCGGLTVMITVSIIILTMEAAGISETAILDR